MLRGSCITSHGGWSHESKISGTYDLKTSTLRFTKTTAYDELQVIHYHAYTRTNSAGLTVAIVSDENSLLLTIEP